MVVNLFLVVFNLIPAFPMDGGRVLRAILSWRGDRVWATRVAAAVGKGLALVMAGVVLLGMGGIIPFQQPLLLFIALFVWIGASQEADAVATTSVLHGVSVRDTMMREFRSASPFDNLRDLSEWLLAGYQQDFPVVAQGEIVGIVSRADLLRGLTGGGPDTLVRDVMRQDFTVASPLEPIEAVLRRTQAGEGSAAAIPVVDGGVLVGLVTAENVGEYVMVKAALKGVRGGRV
jgi:CBS domain-containing protein